MEANIIFGTPFLTKQEQTEDMINSVKWCFENNLDKVNLFPINIKPYTLLYKLYESGKYFPVSHKSFIEALMQIPEKYINRIYLCWYGNREIISNGKKPILPICKDNEYSIFMKFYQDFNMNRNKNDRIKLFKNIIFQLFHS